MFSFWSVSTIVRLKSGGLELLRLHTFGSLGSFSLSLTNPSPLYLLTLYTTPQASAMVETALKSATILTT